LEERLWIIKLFLVETSFVVMVGLAFVSIVFVMMNVMWCVGKLCDKIGGLFMDSAEIFKADEKCWETGIYQNECDCYFCEHKEECSGSDADDED